MEEFHPVSLEIWEKLWGKIALLVLTLSSIRTYACLCIHNGKGIHLFESQNKAIVVNKVNPHVLYKFHCWAGRVQSVICLLHKHKNLRSDSKHTWKTLGLYWMSVMLEMKTHGSRGLPGQPVQLNQQMPGSVRNLKKTLFSLLAHRGTCIHSRCTVFSLASMLKNFFFPAVDHFTVFCEMCMQKYMKVMT